MIFDPAISLMEKALDVASFRHQATALNIANINTPGYKRSEVAFPTVLAEIMKEFRAGQQEAQEHRRRIDAGTMTPMEVEFLQSDTQFEKTFRGSQVSAAVGPAAAAVTARLMGVQPEVSIVTSGTMRFDGNNVNIDMAVADMVKNNMSYSNLTGILAGDFKLLRTVIETK